MKIAVVGTGYVGLVTGACLADVGHDVVCIDIDPEKVATLERGEAFLHEKGLQEIVSRHAGGRLRATTDLGVAVRSSEITMLAVGTPSTEGRIDLGQVRTATRQVGEALAAHDAPHVLVVKSTVVPGTTEDVVGPIFEEASGRRIGEGLGLAMNPEFLREGNAVADFTDPDRIVLGVADELAEAKLRDLYAPFAPVDLLVTTPRTAEAIKYTANALLATMISFSNEIANLVARLPGVDVQDVMEGVHLDRRLSPIQDDGERIRPGILTYLAAGTGFGGSCFPKDVAALRSFAREVGAKSSILDAVLDTNRAQPLQMVQMLEGGLGDLRGKRVAVLGLAFKPDTDDVRESPSLTLVDELQKRGAELTAFDPVARETARAALGDDGVTITETLEAAIEAADGIAVMTAWPEFQILSQLVAGADPAPLVVDGRRMLDRAAFERYAGIGVGPADEGAP